LRLNSSTSARGRARFLLSRAYLVAGLVSGVSITASVVTPADAQRKGWFTQAQVDKGKTIYENSCANCHGEEMAINFTGWDASAADLIDTIVGFGMPADGVLAPQAYIDLAGYFFSLSGMPRGDEVRDGAATLTEIKLK